jgi:DNA-binding transcriptional ArsR family regulator
LRAQGDGLVLRHIKTFEALGNETRLKVLDFIYRSGAQGVKPKQIIEQFGVDSGTLDFHLKRLVAAGLIVVDSSKGPSFYCPSKELLYQLGTLFQTYGQM